MRTKMSPIGAVSALLSQTYWALLRAGRIVFSADLRFRRCEGVHGFPGFFDSILELKLSFGYNRAHSFAGILWQILSFTLLYALSGWLSGFLGGVACNFISKHLGFQVEGVTDSQPSPVHTQ